MITPVSKIVLLALDLAWNKVHKVIGCLHFSTDFKNIIILSLRNIVDSGLKILYAYSRFKYSTHRSKFWFDKYLGLSTT